MNKPVQPYRLTARGGAGLACDEKGLALGGVDLARVRQDANGVAHCEVRSRGEVGQILRAAYGPQTDEVVLRLHRGLRRAAAWIEAGDLGRAGIEAVVLKLPDLAPEAMAKLAEIADLERLANTAWQTELRIPAGQTGAGQWTTGGGAPSAIAPATNVSTQGARPDLPAHEPPSTSSDGTGASASVHGNAIAISAVDESLLIPVSTASTVVGGRAMGEGFALPKGVARLGRAGLLAFAASLLDQWDADVGRDQVTKAMARFGLDPSRPADVMAASAYVWSQYVLPLRTDAPFSGPKLDAASQAVMRFVLANPGAFPAMLQGPASESAKSFSLMIDAANRGLADYAAESRARPPGVVPELQTTSRSARAAIAKELKDGNFQAHHLVPAYNWGKEINITQLAHEAGWNVDDPSNLIGLPANAKAQAEAPEWLPIHNGPHSLYMEATRELILEVRAKFPKDLTPLQARSILEEVARTNRALIMTGSYGEILKIAS
ncbi:MAG: AHH domain-containing protein [Caulobacterales bacterium]